MWAAILGIIESVAPGLLSVVLKWFGASQAQAAATKTTEAETSGAVLEAAHQGDQVDANERKAAEGAAVGDARVTADPGGLRGDTDGFSRTGAGHDKSGASESGG